MADKTLYTRIKNLVKSASEWTTLNPTLLDGEVGFENDTGKFKIGNGSTTWNSLPYVKVNTINNLTSTSTTDPLSAYQGKLIGQKLEVASYIEATNIEISFTPPSISAEA